MKARTRRNLVIVIVSVAIILVLFGFMIHRTVWLRSDSPGVEFEMDGDTVTCVTVRGFFPYYMLSDSTENRVTDAEGNITETYRMEAGFSPRSAMSMKLEIGTSVEATYTYVLQFADKDIIIENGKVVEQSS